MALRGPIGVPVVTVQHRAEAGHAVAPADSPSGAGLFHPPTNHVFTRPFDLPTADCSSLGQPLRIIQTPPMLAHILLQAIQALCRWLLRGAAAIILWSSALWAWGDCGFRPQCSSPVWWDWCAFLRACFRVKWSDCVDSQLERLCCLSSGGPRSVVAVRSVLRDATERVSPIWLRL